MTDHHSISRRDFLAGAAATTGLAGLAGLAGCASANRGEDGTMPDGTQSIQQLWVGTYTEPGRREGVYLLQLDGRTGALARRAAFDVGPNPSFLAVHPNGRVLYAVNEETELEGQPTGGVGAFTVDGAGALARLGEMRLTHGGAPCYVSVALDGRVVLVANYVGGNLAAFPVGADGALASASQVEPHSGTGPDAERQEAPHAHSVLPDPSGRWALSADLGADRVYVYALDHATPGALREVARVAMRPGSGPRHIAVHPTLPYAFVANELDNTVTWCTWDGARGTLAPKGSASTLPAGWSGRSQVADIHLAPSGRTLYVSNRGHDSIAVFAVDEATGALASEQHVGTEGHWPRNFGIDPSGRWLVVANERSGSVVVLARDTSTGRLASTGQRLAVPRPVCVRYRARPSG